MRCVNEFCIYQENNECTLKEIEIGVDGRCERCIYPDIPQEYLKHEKEKLKNRYRREYGEIHPLDFLKKILQTLS